MVQRVAACPRSSTNCEGERPDSKPGLKLRNPGSFPLPCPSGPHHTVARALGSFPPTSSPSWPLMARASCLVLPRGEGGSTRSGEGEPEGEMSLCRSLRGWP